MSEIKQNAAAVSEWHIVSRHFATSVGSYSDKQVATFFDVINGRKLDPGCSQGFMGMGFHIDMGLYNSQEGYRWWQGWDMGIPGSNLFCLTDCLTEYLQDKSVVRYVENRLTAYEAKAEQMKQRRLKLDLSAIEEHMNESTSGFSSIFKAELAKHPAEDDCAHEFRAIRSVLAVFEGHPLVQL